MTKESTGIEYDVWLVSACMSSAVQRNLLQHYGTAAASHDAFCRNDEAFATIVPPRFQAVLQKNNTPEYLRKARETVEKNGIGVIRPNDEDYPESLRNIDDPPGILFCQGDPGCLKRRSLAMVGSRAASYAGQKAARNLSRSLSSHEVTVISGLASGIDTAAHRGCLEGGSPTIAVTGCGLDRVYPADNTSLRDGILSGGGLILSEYAPGEKPAGWHFPVRNRIITGLSKALILVEAKIRSGSMTSVQHALEQGKDVFVYPGDPSSEYFEGNHQLLREGGIYFTSAEDILEDLHWLDNPSTVRQNSDCSTGISPSGPEQEAVIRALRPGPLGFEQLLQATSLDPPVLMGTLTILQIGGLVEALPGKQYQIKH